MTVDDALQEADEARSGLHIISPTASLVTLAAEVRALYTQLGEAHLQLARVEALPALWRAALDTMDVVECADELDFALSGEE